MIQLIQLNLVNVTYHEDKLWLITELQVMILSNCRTSFSMFFLTLILLISIWPVIFSALNAENYRVVRLTLK